MRMKVIVIASCILAAIGMFRVRAVAQQEVATPGLPVVLQPPAATLSAAPDLPGGSGSPTGGGGVPASSQLTDAPGAGGGVLVISGASGIGQVQTPAPVGGPAPGKMSDQYGFSGGRAVFNDELFGTAPNVPDDEHMESWVRRALSIYAQTEDQDSRAKQRDEIAKGLDTIFDIRQEQRVKELHELEARVQKLKATLDQRAASKADILKNRLDYLLREADGLGWGDGIPAPKRFGVTGVMPYQADLPRGQAADPTSVPQSTQKN